MLTQRQSDVLQFIQDFHASKGYGPSIRDIQTRFNMRQPSSAQYHVVSLIKHGFLGRDHGKSRSLRPTKSLSQAISELEPEYII